MASANFSKLAEHLALGTFNFNAVDTYKALLVTVAPTSTAGTGDLDTWVFRNQVTNEVPATGNYTTGGNDCTPVANTGLDATAGTYGVTFDGYTIINASIDDAVGAIIYRDTGSAATDELITWVDFGAPISSTSGDFTVNFSNDLVISTGA